MDIALTDSSLLLYQTEDGQTKIEVRLQDETVWLSQAQLCELFDKDKRTISEHIQNIFKEGELSEESVIRKFRTTASDGKNYQVNYYNLDVIISVGYRISSHRGTQFRIWATQRLKEYLIKNKIKDNFYSIRKFITWDTWRKFSHIPSSFTSWESSQTLFMDLHGVYCTK